ncbi:MAG: DEAD/DEAH box helicase [Thermodesulfobacteriota bacterium]|nr:DEAD/DEAH box helicase [Thermodesulfobacteriota bacterium]
MTMALQFEPGSLIHARGREWVVLPESTDDLILARPVGGLDEETAGIIPAIESVQSSSFPLPGRGDLGDSFSGRLLRDAARLSTRAAAGPFRSFGRIAVEPRPYQLVPLIMALKLNPVRLLIADDVGIGKTVEAVLIARELLDRGEIRRFTVLCPPHLAEQWQMELSEKFHIEAELILSGTIQRLERDLPLDVSVFDRYPFTVVSTDFIKTSRRAQDFIHKCPELVIVDEAHGCTVADGSGRARQQRFELLRRIASEDSRHVILVTATPHSGKEQAFRSLLSLLRKEFADLPPDLDAKGREGIRRKLARHLVQRRPSPGPAPGGPSGPGPRRFRTQPTSLPTGSPGRHQPVPLRCGPKPHGCRTVQGEPVAGSPGAWKASDLSGPPHPSGKQPAGNYAGTHEGGHPRRRLQAPHWGRQEDLHSPSQKEQAGK